MNIGLYYFYSSNLLGLLSSLTHCLLFRFTDLVQCHCSNCIILGKGSLDCQNTLCYLYVFVFSILCFLLAGIKSSLRRPTGPGSTSSSSSSLPGRRTDERPAAASQSQEKPSNQEQPCPPVSHVLVLKWTDYWFLSTTLRMYCYDRINN